MIPSREAPRQFTRRRRRGIHLRCLQSLHQRLPFLSGKIRRVTNRLFSLSGFDIIFP